jgi:hypothetical protein
MTWRSFLSRHSIMNGKDIVKLQERWKYLLIEVISEKETWNRLWSTLCFVSGSSFVKTAKP